MKNYLQVFIVLACSNFAYQALCSGHYMVAAERSYFQAGALVALYVWMRLTSDES